MAYNKYGEDEEVAAARSRRDVDHRAWRNREVLDPAGDLDFESWCQRQRARERAAGTPTTEAEVLAAWDAMYPHTRPGKPSVDSRLHFGRKQPGEDKPVEPAQEIGRPTRP